MLTNLRFARRAWPTCMLLTWLLLLPPSAKGAEPPALPLQDGDVSIDAQEWPLQPGPRQIKIRVHYPYRKLANVDSRSGLMLSLHNWGGVDCVGTADPVFLADRYNVVAICVNYLQSGKVSIDGPEPYDCGYLQALDALRALYYVRSALQAQGVKFCPARTYATGGSGGGNVSLMANKLAPRTFACIVDLCGMVRLSDDIAFHLPGGSDLDARYSRDPAHPYYLSIDDQEVRDTSCPEHLATMRDQGNTCRVIVVHGSDDTTCPTEDARHLVNLLRGAGLSVEPHFVTPSDLDGKVFTSSGHALGDRTQIVDRVAGKYLDPASPDVLLREGASDFERGDDDLRYRTSHGEFVISYRQGYPVGRFERQPAVPSYPDHHDLAYYVDDQGLRRPVRSSEDWALRRRHIQGAIEQVMGHFPSPTMRVPLEVRVEEETNVGTITRRKLSFQSDPTDRVRAWLFLPRHAAAERLPAVLCLHQTTTAGKDEPAGLAGDKSLHYALRLAELGYVTLAPDYPSLGEHDYDFDARHDYQSGSMKAIWDNVRAVDLLDSLAEVDPSRIGCLGHSLGGHSAMFTAVFEPRIGVIVSSCGFTRFDRDDVPSWNGRRYMPRIETHYQNRADLLPFDFTEIVGAFAPRPFLACAALRDDDFDVTGVREIMADANAVYRLFERPKAQAVDRSSRLQAYYPDAPHSFPADAWDVTVQFLEKHLRRTASNEEEH